MENKCPRCYGESSCRLKEELKSQANIGGCVESNLDRTNGGGPYWTESGWNRFVKNVKEATADGCLHPDEVMELADKITADKKEAGELI